MKPFKERMVEGLSASSYYLKDDIQILLREKKDEWSPDILGRNKMPILNLTNPIFYGVRQQKMRFSKIQTAFDLIKDIYDL